MTGALAIGDRVRVTGSGLTGPVGRVAGGGMTYNVHGHGSQVVLIEWPTGTVSAWPRRDVMPV